MSLPPRNRGPGSRTDSLVSLQVQSSHSLLWINLCSLRVQCSEGVKSSSSQLIGQGTEEINWKGLLEISDKKFSAAEYMAILRKRTLRIADGSELIYQQPSADVVLPQWWSLSSENDLHHLIKARSFAMQFQKSILYAVFFVYFCSWLWNFLFQDSYLS